MSTLLAVGAVGEAATGLVLLASPAAFIRLLMGTELSGAGLALGRLTGLALLALGVACWPPGHAAGDRGPAVRALLTYSLLATVHLLALGLGGVLVGRLLWPAVAAHAIFALLLALAWVNPRRGHACSA